MFAPTFIWYLVLTVLGWVSFPLIYHLLPALKDRGFAFSRAFGLLLWAFLFWLLGSFGILRNDLGGILFALGIVLVLVYWSWRKQSEGEFFNWLKENWKMVLVVEILFAIAFFGFAWFRAISPEIHATEKPMELAFINAILRSPNMPPNDPWLAGYAISYYYFGYVMIAMLAKVTGVVSGVAFNLGIAMIFSMVSIGAYGMVYNLLSISEELKKNRSRIFLALLAPLFVLIVSNAEGFLERLHQRGFLWETDANGTLVSTFWQDTLDIKDLENPPILSEDGSPRHWWWWRGSRVVRDYSYPIIFDIAPEEVPEGLVYFEGNAVRDLEVIDEFPFFSFWLADLHPHVLIMPFIFLAMGLALNLYLLESNRKFKIFKIEYEFDRKTFWLAAFVFGGLAFLNMWDFPIYVGLFAMAYLLKQGNAKGWHWERMTEFLVLGLSLGINGVIFYFPFFLSFSSQAGGILPNIVNPTRGWQLWTMFAPLFIPLFVFLLYVLKERKNSSWWKGIVGSVGTTLLLLLASLLLVLGATFLIPALIPPDPLAVGTGNLFLTQFGTETTLKELMTESFSRRINYPGGWLTLTILIGLVLGAVWPFKKSKEAENQNKTHHGFVILMILLGGLLVLVPEFIYLRDNFGNRMNTIFKFYIQAWLLWAVAAAYGSAILLSKIKKSFWAIIYFPILIVVLWIGLSYPAIAWDVRVGGFYERESQALELDGTLHNWYLSPDDQAAVAWLQNAPMGTLVEAVGPNGGQYSSYARISTHTGIPTILGWAGHEGQWRGGYAEVGNRADEVKRIYTSSSWTQTELLLKLYNVRYVYLGQLERNTYDLYEGKLQEYLTVVFQQGNVTIYEVPFWEAD